MILDEIAAKTRERIAERKKEVSLEDIKEKALNTKALDKISFYDALKQDGLNFICEVKKASPSKGEIVADFPYMEIAKEYENAGASAISCLTEPYYFKGSDEYLKEIAANVKIPVLRKDFTVDEYMIYEAKAFGASAVLLICAILDQKTLVRYQNLAWSLGLDALVEAHDEEEVRRAIAAGARIIGVNNRNLKTFEVDINNCINLRPLVPEGTVFVAESGIHTDDDIAMVKGAKVNATLIGEALMRHSDRKAAIDHWKNL